jgi:hypothetical protein
MVIIKRYDRSNIYEPEYTRRGVHILNYYSSKVQRDIN